MTCTKCGHKNSPNDRFCSTCGGSLVGEAKFNKGCIIPILLIVSVFVMSGLLLWGINLLDTYGPKLVPNSTPTRSTPFMLPTTAPATTAPAAATTRPQ